MPLSKFYSFPRIAAGEEAHDEIEEVFDLMRKGDERIVLDPKYKSPTFVLGNTGSGKSTLVLFVATDNKTLRSKESNPGSGDYIIVDDEEKIGSGINSQTSIPELIVDKETQAAFYDCPGFNDTRTSVNEIATSYFTKKIFDFADEMKIVLTVSHSSVREGIDRTDFMNLMRNAITLIKDLDKYDNSIGLVITKVENQYRKVKGSVELVSDENVTAAVANFLVQAKEGIQEKLKMVKGDEKEETFLKNATKLVDKLLVKDSAGKFSKIGLFRRPDEAGPLLEVKLLQERKPGMKKLLYETLKFTKKDSADIGYTISDRAKLDVNKIVEKLRNHVSTEIDKVVAALGNQYQGVADQTQKLLKSFAKDSDADIDEGLAKDLQVKLSSNFDAISKLKSDVVKATKISEIAEAVKTCGTEVELDLEASTTILLQQDNYFEFLQTVNGGLSIGDYSKNFDGILATIAAKRNEILKDTQNTAEKVQERIKNNLSEVVKELNIFYDAKFEPLNIEDLTVEVSKQNKISVEFVEAIKKVNTAQALSREISNMVTSSDIDSAKINVATLTVLINGNYLTVLKIFKDDTNIWSSDWVKLFDSTAQFLQVSEKWYNFLQKLYKKLSTYDYLGSSAMYNVVNIDDWGSENKPQGIQISKTNYKQFLEKIDEKDEVVKTINPDEKKMRELNHVLELTIKQKISTEMKDNGELSIQAVFVKFSEFVEQNGKLKTYGKKVNSVNIFATDTVFFDRDFDAVGEKLHVNIVAPNWEILGTRNINLNGVDGKSITEQAESATEASGKGADGKPGLPGGPAGNFVGVGSEFKAIGNLTITSNGGRGGDGQKGGNGKDGTDGDNANNTDEFRHEVYDVYDNPFGGSTRRYYRFFGKAGGVGGNGGHGGACGLGGAAGNVKVIRKDGAKDLPIIKNDKGSDGANGEGGTRAKGGKNGNNLLIESVEGIFGEKYAEYSRKEEKKTEHAADGTTGTAGHIDSGRLEPDTADSINVGDVVNSFEIYLRQGLHDRFLQQTLRKFLEQFYHDTNEVYDTKTIANTLSNFEDQLVKLANTLTTDEIIYLYQTIIERVTAYSKNPKPSEDTKDYKMALKYIYTAALCQIQFRKASLTPNMVIDVSKYLDLVLANVDDLKNLNEKDSKLQVVNKSKKKFKSNIEKKATEARRCIKYEILPEVDRINGKLADEIDKLVAEVIKLQEDAEKEKRGLERKQRELGTAMMLNVVFGAFKVVAQLAGPIGSVVEVWPTVKEAIKNEWKAPTQLRALGGPLRYEVTDESDESDDSDSSEESDDSDDSGDKPKEPETLVELVGKLVSNIKEGKVKLPEFDSVTDLIKKYGEDKEKIDTVEKAIKEQEDKFKALQEFEKKIHDTMVPKLDEIEKTLKELSGQMGSKSQVGLDVSKWNIQSMLRDVKLQMKQATTGYKVQDDIARCIEKLEDAMTTQINLYDRVQNYQDQENLANFIADVSTGVDESDPVLSQSMRTLDIMMRSSLILEQHKQAVNALIQHVFPFASLYLTENISLPNAGTDEGLQNIALEAAKKLGKIKSKLNEYKASLTKQDQYLTKSEFNSSLVSVRPFFVWPNKDFKEKIAKLLAGKKVTLYTDVRSANIDKFAVKFNLSEINFKIVDNTKQKDLNEKLKRFKANMTHMGNSYYRFQDRIYEIHSESQKIQYTFERRVDGRPTKFNGIYEKIKNGDLTLSPYAMWELELKKAEPDDVDHFKDLKAFEGQVDLELVGEGNYVSNDVKIPNLRVDDYYEPSTTTFANKF